VLLYYVIFHIVGKPMHPSFILFVKYFFTAAAVFCAGIFSSFFFRMPLTADVWAASSAIATVATVIAGFWVFGAQRKASIDDQKARDAAVMLGLHQLAKEIVGISFLAGFQNDSDSNPIIYPDIPAECHTLAEMLAGLPLDVISAHGQMARLLHLRRIAIELAQIWAGNSERDGTVFLSNRTRLTELKRQAGTVTTEVAAYIRQISPELYEKNKSIIEKM